MDNWTRFKTFGYPELDSEPRLARYEKRLRRQMFDMAAEQDELEKRLSAVPKLATETEVRLDGFEFAGALFTGQADRIDRFEDGIVVLDYKLGGSKTHENELQVAAYCAMLAASRKEKILGFGWLGHAGPSLSGYFSDEIFSLYAFGGTAKKRASAGERMDAALELMTEMAESVRRGEYPPGTTSKAASARPAPTSRSAARGRSASILNPLSRRRRTMTQNNAPKWHSLVTGTEDQIAALKSEARLTVVSAGAEPERRRRSRSASRGCSPPTRRAARARYLC